MKRITVTITDEQNERLGREARRRRVSVSELVREKLEAPVELPGFLGIADQQLPYDSAEVDSELAKTFGRE
ncbi:MAG: ribbon-helix-helix protein, CopG family [Dehalococcoidia bacterium]|jgi:hypothetical protein